ncbi:MAG: hypothetical protein ABI439_03630 [Rhodospirillales bacterium]
MQRKFVVSMAALALLAPSLAWADAIDGDWCSPDNKLRVSIRGPDIVTPGGAHIQGDYTRHAFTYVVPAKEPGAGKKAEMFLMGEYAMQFKAGPVVPSDQVWKRCAKESS